MEELLHLLMDPAHLAYEVIFEVLFFTLEYVIVRRAISAYDRKKHGHRH